MGIFFGNTSSTYTGLKSIGEREDADGKVWVYATAEVSLTGGQAEVLRMDAKGWVGFALFDTGLASTTAAARLGFKIGVPASTIPSGSDGWLQVGGYCDLTGDASQSTTTNNTWRWVDATVTGSVITAASFSQAGICDAFAISMATATAATFPVFLMNKWVAGTTT